jgi:hypothetical protein
MIKIRDQRSKTKEKNKEPRTENGESRAEARGKEEKGGENREVWSEDVVWKRAP